MRKAPKDMPETLCAIVAGHICLDILPDLESLSGGQLQDLLRPGKLLQIGGLTFAGGGPVSNTGLALKILGVPVGLIAKTGEDSAGEVLRDWIESRHPGLVGGLKTDPVAATSYTIILGNRTTDRIFLHCTGANDTFGPEDIDYSLVEKADLFHFGYPTVMRRMYRDGGRDFMRLMRGAKETGATTSLDLSLPDPNTESGRVDWRPIYRDVLPYVDIFLPSLDELLFTLRREEFDRRSSEGELVLQASPSLLGDLSAELMERGVKIVMIKLGSRGVYLRTASTDAMGALGRAQPGPDAGWASRERWVPCFRADVVGTTGSGDATIAGFLAGLLKRVPIGEALLMSVAVGACNVEAADSLSGLSTWESTWERIRSGWKQAPLAVEGDGWRREEPNGMWIGPNEGLS
jgi:sugar/nucleoside kinase (ribokinase family)